MTSSLSESFSGCSQTENPYMRVAKQYAADFSKAFQSAFDFACSLANQQIEVIKPIFFTAVNGFMPKMDKISGRAKAGQMPWPQPGIGNGAFNTIIAAQRKFARIFRDLQSRNYSIQYS